MAFDRRFFLGELGWECFFAHKCSTGRRLNAGSTSTKKDFLKVQCAISDVRLLIHLLIGVLKDKHKKQNGCLLVTCGCAGHLSSALAALKLPPHLVHFGFFEVQLRLKRLDLREIRRTLRGLRANPRAVETLRTFLVSSFSRSVWAWAFSLSRASCACLCWSFSWLAVLRESRKTRISPFFIRISSSTSFSWEERKRRQWECLKTESW